MNKDESRTVENIRESAKLGKVAVAVNLILFPWKIVVKGIVSMCEAPYKEIQ